MAEPEIQVTHRFENKKIGEHVLLTTSVMETTYWKGKVKDEVIVSALLDLLAVLIPSAQTILD